MVSLSRPLPLLFILSLLAAGATILWRAHHEVKRVDGLTAQGSPEPARDTASPTGYQAGQRWLITSDPHKESYALIAETQKIASDGPWRLREVDYDNSPTGRAVDRASPYRWTLAATAAVGRLFTDNSTGRSIERTARWIEPLIQFGFLLLLSFWVWRRFGSSAAGIFALGWANLYPLAGNFIGGAPNDYGLSLGLAAATLLGLTAGLVTPSGEQATTRRHGFLLSGFCGGIGIWVTPGITITLVATLTVGGLIMIWLTRRQLTTPATAHPLPWRAWATSGAITTLVAFLLEYAPGNLGVGLRRFDLIHPLHALFWWGCGECLVGVQTSVLRGQAFGALIKAPRKIIGSIGGLVALVGSIAGLASAGQLTRIWFDPGLSRLAAHPGSVDAATTFAWLGQPHRGPALLATLLPLCLLGPVGFFLVKAVPTNARRPALLLLLGPVIGSLILSLFFLQWWAITGLSLLVISLLLLGDSMLTSSLGLTTRRLALIATFIAIFPGAISLARIASAPPKSTVAATDASSLLERDIAYWLANRVGPAGATILAPPNLTTSLFYHGGLRGIASPYVGNSAGFGAAVRIAGATSPDEALALVNQRKLTHLILPSWDGFMDEYARLGATQVDTTLTAMLHQWLPPRWLKPVPYTLPLARGLENQFVVVYEVVDVQDNATALGRLGDYFIAMQQLGLAQSVAQTLETSFANDLGALITRANLAAFERDPSKFVPLVEQIDRQIADVEFVDLPWDRRVALAVVLAQGKKMDAARLEAEACADEADEQLLRLLSSDALYRWEILRDNLQLDYFEPGLDELARSLLPAHLREAL
jgi:hypothetical protein